MQRRRAVRAIHHVRIKVERDLSHGDFVFIGRKLLRVEINAN